MSMPDQAACFSMSPEDCDSRAIRLVTTGVRQLIRGSCDESSHGRLFYISELHHAPPTKHWTAFPIRSYSRFSNAMIPFNPFGLTIIYFREDQVFQ